jgi:hypothetical protein
MVHMQVNTHAEVAIYGPVLAVLHMELHFFLEKAHREYYSYTCTKFGKCHTNLIWHHIPQPITSQNQKLQFTINFLILAINFQVNKLPPFVIRCINDIR